jgi:RNA polymerase sigma-54 factor
MKCLVDNLELVARGERRMLRRLCGVDDDDLDGMIAEIRSLDPQPGLSFAGEPAPLVVPDVIVRADDAGGWQVELNAETLPRLVINNAYRAHISARGKRPEKSYISECFNSAHWLIKALHQRSETILKVASEIFRRQEGFLTDGVMQLRPLVLRDIAEAVGLHESTVSRATSNKYVDTPRGVFELKYFFSSSIAGADGDELSGTSVRHRIGELIAAEDGNDILSDDRIAEMLKAEGIAIARRTVAKYREDLGIGSSTARRRARRLER